MLDDYDQLIFCTKTLDVFTNPHFPALIDELEVGEFVVFGVAADYCVFEAAKGLLERGQRVKIVSDATRPISKDTEAETRKVLSSLGARWVSAAEVLQEKS